MGSLRGFRCRRCRGELLASAESAGRSGRPEWTPPILCCGESLRPLAPDQILAELLVGVLARGRVARCPRCEYQVRLVVHPAGALMCGICQKPFEIITRQTGWRDGLRVTASEDGWSPSAAGASGAL